MSLNFFKIKFYFKIYIGREHWIGYDNFKVSTDNVKTSAQVAKNLAVAIFGYSTLLNATLSGLGSNRNKRKQKPQFKLDGTKVLCLKGNII